MKMTTKVSKLAKKVTSKNKTTDLRALLVQKINALYDVEKALVVALPKMAKASTDKMLKAGFIQHLAETKIHVKRLEEVSKILGVKPKALKSDAIRGLIKDGEWVIKNVKPADAMNANLARAAQCVEHYEMAGYIGALDWATVLGETQIIDLLTQTFEEENTADEKMRDAGSMLDEKIK